MFIDYLTLIMILAYYLWKGIDEVDQKPYAAAFFGVGLLSLITGRHLSFNWPLPGSYLLWLAVESYGEFQGLGASYSERITLSVPALLPA